MVRAQMIMQEHERFVTTTRDLRSLSPLGVQALRQYCFYLDKGHISLDIPISDVPETMLDLAAACGLRAFSWFLVNVDGHVARIGVGHVGGRAILRFGKAADFAYFVTIEPAPVDQIEVRLFGDLGRLASHLAECERSLLRLSTPIELWQTRDPPFGNVIYCENAVLPWRGKSSFRPELTGKWAIEPKSFGLTGIDFEKPGDALLFKMRYG